MSKRYVVSFAPGYVESDTTIELLEEVKNEIASKVKNNVNKALLEKHHAFDVRNTKTKYDDEQMQLSLTYFAVTNNKPAFAIESSKNLSSLSQKVYYQLLAIEEFMRIMDISFKRKFLLNETNLNKILSQYGDLRINNNISLNLSNIKNTLRFIPIRYKYNEFEFSHPLGSIKRGNGENIVYIGNKKVTTLRPQYFKMDEFCPNKIEIEIDGNITFINPTQEFIINDDFKIINKDGVRVNVIGFTSKNVFNESGITIHRDSLNKKFALDRDNKTFRIEFYKNDNFCSMSVVHFK